ncbi:MAG: hypothetical protein GC153_10660 [Alphaproteobacteria bacterium]|nr:hypothetical protein [Alphaproteobacteria bacterium]
MKLKLIAVASAALLAAAGLGAAATSASAQDKNQKGPVILVLNQAEVIQQSKAGQSMRPQLEKLQKDATDEYNAAVESLVKESEDLKKQKDLMAQDVWTQKAQQLQQKQQNLPVLREQKVRELELSQQKAIGVINDALQPILKKIVDDRGATVLLDGSAVMYASVDADITPQVISELNKKLTSVTVEKVSLEDLQKQAAAAQKAASDSKKKK